MRLVAIMLKKIIHFPENTNIVLHYVEINNYVLALNKEILNDESSELWLIGRMVAEIETKNISDKTSVFHSITDLVHYL